MSRLMASPIKRMQQRRLSSLVIRMILVWRTSNMLCENADYGAPSNGVAIEVVRLNAFNRFAEAQKLSLALNRQTATLACELIHSGAAYLTRDCFVLIQHRKFKGHPVHVVTQNPAPRQRHLDHPRHARKMRGFFESLSRGSASEAFPCPHPNALAVSEAC